MPPLFQKLNLGGHRRVTVLNAPPSFEAELAALAGVAVVREARAPLGFGLAFAVTVAERDAACAALCAAAEGDAVLWLAYPKGTSKAYRAEFNRDSGWAVFGAAGYEPVRQVAIDADWSALRFRRTEFIPSLKRHPDGAISPQGQARTKR